MLELLVYHLTFLLFAFDGDTVAVSWTVSHSHTAGQLSLEAHAHSQPLLLLLCHFPTCGQEDLSQGSLQLAVSLKPTCLKKYPLAVKGSKLPIR